MTPFHARFKWNLPQFSPHGLPEIFFLHALDSVSAFLQPDYISVDRGYRATSPVLARPRFSPKKTVIRILSTSGGKAGDVSSSARLKPVARIRVILEYRLDYFRDPFEQVFDLPGRRISLFGVIAEIANVCQVLNESPCRNVNNVRLL